jgi:hypothetical protein
MKTLCCLIPLLGTTLLAAAAEPAQPTFNTRPLTLSTTTNATVTSTVDVINAADKTYDRQISQQLIRSGALTIKPSQSPGRALWQSFNPFAPVKRSPQTPRLSRAAWSTAATTAGHGTTPIEMCHEARFGVMVVSR